jgi:hypothetical protein
LARKRTPRPADFVHCPRFAEHFAKSPLRELPLQFCIGSHRVLLIEAVEVKMHVPVTPAWPQEPTAWTSGNEPRTWSKSIHAPGVVSVRTMRRFPRFRIDEVQIHFVLIAI